MKTLFVKVKQICMLSVKRKWISRNK